MVLEPRLMVLMFELPNESTVAFIEYPAVVNVPLVTVSVCELMFRASASCTVPP